MEEMGEMLLLDLHCKVFDRLGIKRKALVGLKNGLKPLYSIPSTLMQQALPKEAEISVVNSNQR